MRNLGYWAKLSLCELFLPTILGDKLKAMSLHDILDTLRQRAEAGPLWERRAVFGFATPGTDYKSLVPKDTGYRIIDGVPPGADVVIQGTLAGLRALFGDPPDFSVVGQQVKFLPEDDWLVDQVLAAFGLTPPPDLPRFKHIGIPRVRYPRAENVYPVRAYTPALLPTYDPDSLPRLIAEDHPAWVEVYNKAWEIAFSNLRHAEPGAGFVADFIDTAFNDNTFMWDSCFMMMFGRYGRRLFRFMGTLDNFYAHQHDGGFICREINTYDGRDIFTPYNPSSTGPPIMAWTEWLDYQLSGDVQRLRAVFPALVAYHGWWRDWRTWPDGSYFTTGWGSGMDNQTRVSDSTFYHHHYSWVDATMQQALDCRILQQMGQVIGRHEFDEELEREYRHLTYYINSKMWDDATGFYYDVGPDGTLSPVKSIGAYWGLLADIVPEDRARRLCQHLSDPATFNRAHRVPSQAADSRGYEPGGAYWRGGVWAPTNYMVLQALTHYGAEALAFEIARNHVENVAQVYQETGTLWENYAPESAAPSHPAKPDFVGWTGVSAITIPLEYLIGLRPADSGLLWDIRLTGRHGVQGYPFGTSNLVDLMCHPRVNQDIPPRFNVTTREPLSLAVRWSGGARTHRLEPGSHDLTV